MTGSAICMVLHCRYRADSAFLRPRGLLFHVCILHDADPVRDLISSGHMIGHYWSADGRPVVLPVAGEIPDEPDLVPQAKSALDDPQVQAINADASTLIHPRFDVVRGR